MKNIKSLYFVRFNVTFRVSMSLSVLSCHLSESTFLR